MAWELKLNSLTHDLTISNGRFLQVNGSDEIAQRVKVALWHHFGEYFLNKTAGVPWYDAILGRLHNKDIVNQIIRRQILLVAGVIRIIEFNANLGGVSGDYSIQASIEVEKGVGETTLILPLEFNINSKGEVIT